MQQADQEASGFHEDRQARLAEIFDEHGWPGHDLVGEEGSTAAWVTRSTPTSTRVPGAGARAADGGGGGGQRLAGRPRLPQRPRGRRPGRAADHGTQIRCERKKPVPPTPIADPATVDELRAEAGLEPLDVYLDEMKKICQEV